METDKRIRSPFRYDGENAIQHDLRIRDRDREIFRLLNPETGYHFLPSNWIHAFVGGNPNRLPKRLAHLARYRGKEAPYLARQQEWYKHAIYSRTEVADRLLGESPLRSSDHFAHRLLEDLVQASLELGVHADATLEITNWQGLVALGKLPPHILAVMDRGKNPHLIPLRDGHVLPDGRPFRLKRKGSDKALYVLGKEIDRDTEPGTSTRKRRTIEQKLRHYREVFERKLWREHYGFPNSVVLFVTTSETRMHEIRRIAERVMDGACSYILVTHWKDWAREPRYPVPTGDMLTRPWQRVGYPDFYLNRFEEM